MAEAARLMVRESVKRLPVLDSAGRLIGIVGRSDVLKAAAHTVGAPPAHPPARWWSTRAPSPT